MKIGATCAGQHVFWEYLSQGGYEHWGELLKGGVVQGRIKVISPLYGTEWREGGFRLGRKFLLLEIAHGTC
jgi:hypothetical protein